MLFTSIFDLNLSIINFFTFSSIKTIFLLNRIGSILVGSIYNNIIDSKVDTECFIYAHGCLNIIGHMLNDKHYVISSYQFGLLCLNGHLNVIKNLKKIVDTICITNVKSIIKAASNNQLDVVKYLYHTTMEQVENIDCYTKIEPYIRVEYLKLSCFDKSEISSHTFASDINSKLKYTLKKIIENANKNAILLAASKGYLNIVFFLYENGVVSDNRVVIALESALENGYLSF